MWGKGDTHSAGSSFKYCTTDVEIEVEVTLRPTVSRSVPLGVLHVLKQAARCYIYLSDNYFLYFSYRAPSLTIGRACNFKLHCHRRCVGQFLLLQQLQYAHYTELSRRAVTGKYAVTIVM
jgi:hypothetical protein